MQRLPLFPLHSVLFPGMPITLRIFEERYKLMIHECIDQRKPFGVVLIKSGAEVKGMGPDAIPYPIGCTAQITQMQPLIAGQMNIVAVGRERFLIRSLEFDQPYLVGQVEMIPLPNNTPLEVIQSVRKLRPWVERYLTLLGRAENIEFDFSQLPQDALMLTYLSASLIKVDLEQKQALLEAENALALVQEVRNYYRKEVTLLSALMEQEALADQGPFSIN
jgi:Lon protease-like protein